MNNRLQITSFFPLIFNVIFGIYQFQWMLIQTSKDHIEMNCDLGLGLQSYRKATGNSGGR